MLTITHGGVSKEFEFYDLDNKVNEMFDLRKFSLAMRDKIIA